MSYLLLTSKEGVAQLLNLDQPLHQRVLRGTFEAVAHGQDDPWDGLYVIDPEIMDGVPTRCTTEGSPTPPKFDEDDYADVHVTIVCMPLDQNSVSYRHEVHRLGYRIDGRS